MSRNLFTEEQINILRQNPYVYSVTGSRITLTEEFKKLFFNAYNAGESPRMILENFGFDTAMLGERRIWGIAQRICEEYEKYGEFHTGYTIHNQSSTDSFPDSNRTRSDKDELKQLRHEVEYLKQEIEFLKKISSIRRTQK